MLKNREYLFLFLLVIATILPKWIISWLYFDNSIFVDTIFNVKDMQYFPIVKSFSELTFNPSYLDHLSDNRLLTFPIYSIFFHSIFFKLLNVYSFFILELIFKFIFLLVFFKVIKKIFIDLNYSLYFCLSLFLLIAFLQTILSFDHNQYLRLLFDTLDENLGSRFPRPLFTGVIYFYFFYILYNFEKKLENFNLKYFIVLTFILTIFLNSFFYYFLNFSLLLILLLIIHIKFKFLLFLKNQKKNILIILLCSIFFSSPFLFQLYFGEVDYSERIGVINIDQNQKIYLLKYYLLNLLRVESIALLIATFLTHYYINKNYSHLKKQTSRINLFFYFVLASIISPLIFFILSPKLVSIYHFLGILLFILIFYLMISLNFLLCLKINLKSNYIFKVILVFFIFVSNIYIAKKNIIENTLLIKETQKIQEYFQNQKLVNTKKKLFTNDLGIMNLWLLNKNNQLIISDGFTNSLKNKDIEFNFIHSLKDFGVTREELKSFLSLGKSKIRNNLLMRLFNYRYQANSLYTFSELSNYSNDIKDNIINTSPFRAQNQIMPENEKRRLIKLYEKIRYDEKLSSDLIIMNKTDEFNNFKIRNSKYYLVYSGNVYDIYQIN